MICELPGRQLDRHEIMDNSQIGRSERQIPPSFGPEASTPGAFPYSWGLGHLSSSLYENQFPVSLGGVGSSLASGYSVLGAFQTSNGKEKALEPYERKHIDGPGIGTGFSSSGVNHRASGQDNKQGKQRDSQNGSTSASAGRSPDRFESTKPNEDRAGGSNGEDGDDGDDEDGNNRKRKRFKSLGGDQDRGRFACPYHIHDPVTYGISDRRYERCALTRFQYISGLE
jgi:hypothetical protein